MLFFSERQNYFEEKNKGFLNSCLGLAICKRGAKLIFQALPRKFDFVDSCGDLLLINLTEISNDFLEKTQIAELLPIARTSETSVREELL